MGIKLDSNKTEDQKIKRYCRHCLGLKYLKTLRRKFLRQSCAKNIGKIMQVEKKL